MNPTPGRSRTVEQEHADYLTERGWSCWPPEQAARVHASILFAHAAGHVDMDVAQEWNDRVQVELQRINAEMLAEGVREGWAREPRHLRAVPGDGK